MATGQQEINLDYYLDDSDDDDESVISVGSADTVYPIERILAEFTGKNGHVWYLVKWLNCPLVQSSWECVVLFTDTPWIFDEWQVEKKRQAEGKSQPLNIAAFNKAVLDVEIAERQRRKLRRLRKQAEHLLAAVTAS